MLMRTVLVAVLCVCVGVSTKDRSCYWRAECQETLFATRTPYDTVRGDIRDWPLLAGCEAISMWALVRHGNRNPGDKETINMRELQARIKDDIIEHFDYEMGSSQLCAQDIENFRKWNWNTTMDTSPSYLTGIGYQEIYALGSRIRQKYPQLLESQLGVYVRPTYKQRTVTSAMAFLQAFNEGNELNLTADEFRQQDDVLRPYDNCPLYKDEVKNGQLLNDQLEAFFKTTEYLQVQKSATDRLGLSQTLSVEEIFTLYELCRFHRTWSTQHKSPWCAAFSSSDLLVLEYRDDVRHYYKNAYGSPINAKLGYPVLKNLYESLELAKQGQGKSIVTYFAHDTLLGMVYSALGLYKDGETITAQYRNPNRNWRTSHLAPFSANIMAYLNRCNDGSYKVQIFNNEKPTLLCPLEGCTWDQFASIFQPFTDANLDFCKLKGMPKVPGSAADFRSLTGLLSLTLSIMIL
ncbi:multiple inositol polyphosphate phosphatase 1-like [Pieris brassicae]|uniref:multiple inositol polyphosphate phosphatase 1-like n=1 Tax=Pieris brassicae TaxID=7116 RepID=UPI001E6605B2|nr:multiple inositol polyphosphate phosphatase 1-like [Pieris brassicae]